MTFHADLHVHSKYSRATSRDLDLEHLAWWAARKGIGVVGTGDCVHPAWLAEIKDKLVPDGGGLFRLKPEIEAEIEKTLPPACRRPVRFMLSTEISTIYKKGEKTRKIHHLIYAADLAAADRLAAQLGRIGNIASDGRPILGLDSRDLLEIALESGPDSYLVPAHIWTPWFAALGSQSGFDSIEECYGDLTHHIFAVETGLSSDPAMNWRVSFLDRYRLTSNSDAHSPGKLGREATRFSCEPDYFAIRRALETGEGYEGTVEFFPEEGKYHMDGHRACGVRLEPKETLALDGRCPVCGNRVTVGVAHRVELLADRSEAEAVPPLTAGEVASLVPLPEMLSEILGSGVASKAVGHAYDRATAALGPELSVLAEVPVEDIGRADSLLGEAVARLRAGAVIRQAGYDGEYGVIRLFEEGELDRFTKGDLLFDVPVRRRKRAVRPQADQSAPAEAPSQPAPSTPAPSGREGVLAALDADQAQAAAMIEGPLTVVAGPGSGKTRMLTRRIAHLVVECGVPAASCLAATFTRKATEELRARLAVLLPGAAKDVAVHSFHSLGLAILRAHGGELGLALNFRIAGEKERTAALAAALNVSERRAVRFVKAVSVMKRTGVAGEGEEAEARATLDRLGREGNWVDFDDLVALAVGLLEGNAEIATRWRERFTHIVADEFQDVDERQYRLLQLLAGASGNLCVIGDPNQAIYGFRGADATCFTRFARDFPSARTARLKHNYRSTGTIVTASAQLMGAAPDGMTRPMETPIVVHTAANGEAEAAFVAAAIEELLGGHDMLAAHGGKPGRRGCAPLGFADFAVLYRTDTQSAALREAFDRTGIPFKKSSPAPIAGHAGVAAILRALEGKAHIDMDLPTRLAAAAEAARQEEEADAAALAEARGWLTALAASEAVGGDAALLGEQVALSTEADFRDPRADRVLLVTMHAAKGLEFPVVFVVGMEDGLVPFSWGPSAEQDEKARAEERRLFYVAMTRAMDRLFLTRATERFWRGAVRALPPSPFLGDIADKLTASHAATKQKSRARQLSLF
ncbi:UvrD-helicase domain-containing protein [Chelativorans xinjiangense]|uniref:UvrD-helicase domain-containing protein n=1 Tax=Chelativorans xinjiangense TaxID=2681485 RepID=UPI001359DB5D|nr:UvrD-helicase domain-containing protein [Chelativorans xinjiangense]